MSTQVMFNGQSINKGWVWNQGWGHEGDSPYSTNLLEVGVFGEGGFGRKDMSRENAVVWCGL